MSKATRKIKCKTRTVEDNESEEDENVEDETETTELLFDMNYQSNKNDNIKPRVGEFWKIRNGSDFLFSIIASENPLAVQYFEPMREKNVHSLNATVFDVYEEDLHEKIEPPKVIHKGSHRKFYYFE